jgi:hypothetical protein
MVIIAFLVLLQLQAAEAVEVGTHQLVQTAVLEVVQLTLTQ